MFKDLAGALSPAGSMSAAEQLQVRGTGLCAHGGLPSPKMRLSGPRPDAGQQKFAARVKSHRRIEYLKLNIDGHKL
jgi:hypothetical protein